MVYRCPLLTSTISWLSSMRKTPERSIIDNLLFVWSCGGKRRNTQRNGGSGWFYQLTMTSKVSWKNWVTPVLSYIAIFVEVIHSAFVLKFPCLTTLKIPAFSIRLVLLISEISINIKGQRGYRVTWKQPHCFNDTPSSLSSRVQMWPQCS